MALNVSGPISLAGSTSGQSIAVELGKSATGQISLNDADVRSLAGVPSGAIVMPTNFYGKANEFAFTISSNTTNANLCALAIAAGWNGSSAVAATIGTNVYVYSTSTGTPGLCIPNTFPGGVSIINNGFIVGKGGDTCFNNPGCAGGTALSIGRNVTITNNCYIAGGGGGGGSVVRVFSGPDFDDVSWAAGGGGAGGGLSCTCCSGSAAGGTPTSTTGANGGTCVFNAVPNSRRAATGGGGGYGFPGTGGGSRTSGASNNPCTLGGLGGTSGGGGGLAIASSCAKAAGGGGGGWGASGGTGIGGCVSGGITSGAGGSSNSSGGSASGGGQTNSQAGGAGGKAICLNGNSVTYCTCGNIYGAVS